MGFEKALVAVKVIKDRIQYRSQSFLNLARGYFTHDDLLREINWMNVKQLISHDLAVTMFKIRNGLSPSQCNENLQTIGEIHGYQTRSVTSND